MPIDKSKQRAYNGGMNKIDEFLAEKGMTQTELAARLGYDLSYVNQIINGRKRITDAFRWRWQNEFGARAQRYLNGDQDGTQ